MRTATQEHIKADEGTGYGYFWRTIRVDGERVYFATGTGGQMIVNMPSRDLVAVWQIWVDTATRAEQAVSTKVDEVYVDTIAPGIRLNRVSGGARPGRG